MAFFLLIAMIGIYEQNEDFTRYHEIRSEWYFTLGHCGCYRCLV